jgi:hypothetical protein
MVTGAVVGLIGAALLALMVDIWAGVIFFAFTLLASGLLGYLISDSPRQDADLLISDDEAVEAADLVGRKLRTSPRRRRD